MKLQILTVWYFCDWHRMGWAVIITNVNVLIFFLTSNPATNKVGLFVFDFKKLWKLGK